MYLYEGMEDCSKTLYEPVWFLLYILTLGDSQRRGFYVGIVVSSWSAAPLHSFFDRFDITTSSRATSPPITSFLLDWTEGENFISYIHSKLTRVAQRAWYSREDRDQSSSAYHVDIPHIIMVRTLDVPTRCVGCFRSEEFHCGRGYTQTNITGCRYQNKFKSSSTNTRGRWRRQETKQKSNDEMDSM